MTKKLRAIDWSKAASEFCLIVGCKTNHAEDEFFCREHRPRTMFKPGRRRNGVWSHPLRNCPGHTKNTMICCPKRHTDSEPCEKRHGTGGKK